MNVQDSPGVSLYYAPVTYFNTPASKEPVRAFPVVSPDQLLTLMIAGWDPD